MLARKLKHENCELTFISYLFSAHKTLFAGLIGNGAGGGFGVEIALFSCESALWRHASPVVNVETAVVVNPDLR